MEGISHNYSKEDFRKIMEDNFCNWCNRVYLNTSQYNKAIKDHAYFLYAYFLYSHPSYDRGLGLYRIINEVRPVDTEGITQIHPTIMCSSDQQCQLYRLPGAYNGSQVMGMVLEYVLGSTIKIIASPANVHKKFNPDKFGDYDRNQSINGPCYCSRSKIGTKW